MSFGVPVSSCGKKEGSNGHSRRSNSRRWKIPVSRCSSRTISARGDFARIRAIRIRPKTDEGCGTSSDRRGWPLNDVHIDMVPTGAISGRVTNASGEPIAIVDVFALKSSYQEGQRILTQVLSAKTDERGEFRMFWLTPGSYLSTQWCPMVQIRPIDHEQ